MPEHSLSSTQMEGFDMGFPSPAADYVEAGINLNEICHYGGPSSRLYVTDRYQGQSIKAGSTLLIDSSIKPVDGHLLLARVDGELGVWRLVTILRRGLESLIDKDTFIMFGDEFMDDAIEVEGVITHAILDMRNDVFDDTPCI